MSSNPEIDSKGTKRWRNDQGLLHRTDGPAVEWSNGSKYWWVNDKLHRIDGPAVERASGSKYWWVDDIQYDTEEEYWSKIKELGLNQIKRQPKMSRFKRLQIR